MKKKINNKSIKEIINEGNKPKELPETELPIKTINKEWKHLKAINFEKEYVEVDIDLLTNIINSKKEQYCDNDIVKSCLDEILKLVKNN